MAAREIGLREATIEPENTIADVYRAQYGRLVASLSRFAGDRSQAEELASEAVYRLSAQQRLLRENVDGWLYRTAKNLCMDRIKARSRRSRYEHAAAVESARTATAVDPLEECLRIERCKQVRTVLAALKPIHAQLLLLRHDGVSYREIAVILNINPALVGNLVSRATRQFAEHYAARFGTRI